MFNILNRHTVEYSLLMKIRVSKLTPGYLFQEKYTRRGLHKDYKRQTNQREVFSWTLYFSFREEISEPRLI